MAHKLSCILCIEDHFPRLGGGAAGPRAQNTAKSVTCSLEQQ